MASQTAVLSGLVLVAGVGLAAAWLVSWRTLLLGALAASAALTIFIAIRHVQIVHGRRSVAWPRPGGRRLPGRPPADEYFLFVLGSGGHSKEMLMMMDDGFCDVARVHRRYVVSSGDGMSHHHLADYEQQLAGLCRAARTSPGTFDTRVVARARRVHQPLWSAPWTCLGSILDVVPVLLSAPRHGVGAQLRYPTQIFSNGPATGFLVGLAAHLLKLFCLVPADRMRFVYIESWARISTLSLTGKLLYYTGIADALYVQHGAVAAAYGLVNAGQVVFNSRRPDA